MRNLPVLLKIFLLLGASSFAGPALAQEGSSASIGLIYGVSVPDASDTTARYLGGLTGSVRLASNFTLGGYFVSSAGPQEPGGRNFNYSIHGLRALYQMGGTYFGLMGGLTKVKTVQDDVSLIFSPYHYGILSGHDFPLWNWISIGFDGFLIKVENSNTTIGATRYHEDPFNIIGFSGTLKFQF